MASFALRSFMVATVMLISATAFADPGRERSVLPIRTAASRTYKQSVVVTNGDHLWKISAAHLEAELERKVASTEISPYWRNVIAANIRTLRSGDPDLIYPGEVVLLPERVNEMP